MAAKTIEAQLVLTGRDAGASKAIGDVAKVIKDLAAAGKVSAEVQKLTKELERAGKAEKAFADAASQQAAFAKTRTAFREAQGDVAKLARELDGARRAQAQFEGVRAMTKTGLIAKEMADAARAVKVLEKDLGTAQRTVRATSAAYEAQAAALKAAKREADAFALPVRGIEAGQRSAKSAIEATTHAIERQIRADHEAAAATKRLAKEEADASRLAHQATERRANVVSSRTALASMAGIYVGHKAGEVRKEVAHTYADFDDKIRYQRAVADLTPDERRSRVAQAVHLGGTTSFNDLQVLEAQLTLAQRNIKKSLIEPFIKEIVNYAQAMNTDLPSAAKTLEGVTFSTNQNVEDPATAAKVMRQNVDLLVKTAKVGGLDNEGVAQAFKFGGATGAGAGLSNITMGTIFAALHRAGYGGDEAGVATRAIASKLVAPTSKGMAALATMGIRYNDYTKMPGGLSADTLAGKMRQDFGKDLSASQKRRIQGAIDDGTFTGKDGQEVSILNDQGQFTQALSGIVAESFPLNKKGQHSAKDMQAIAKKIGDFYKLSIESVNSEGLLEAILAKTPTLGQANALVTEKHGGKVIALAKRLKDFVEIHEALSHVQDGFAQGVGDERMGGFSGARKRLGGSWLNVQTAIGRAWDNDGEGGGLLTKFYDTAAKFTQHIAEMDANVLRAGSVIGYVGGKLAEGSGTLGLIGAAFALKGSAASLDAAAVRLGAGGSLPGSLAKRAAPAVAGGALAAGAVVGGGLAAVATLGVLAGGKQQAEELVQLRDELAELNKTRERRGESVARAEAGNGDLGAARDRLAETEKRIALVQERLRGLDSGQYQPGITDDRESRIGRERLRADAAEAGKAAGEATTTGFKAAPFAEAGQAAGSAIVRGVMSVLGALQSGGGIASGISFSPGGGGGGGFGGMIQKASWGGGTLAVGSGSGVGHTASQSERAAYIRARASALGMDPATALRVAQSEGFYTYTGDHGQSFGDWQLYTGGGLGNKALAAGIDIRNPNTWRAQTDFALRYAKKHGWTDWHGAARVGIGKWRGINPGQPGSGVMPEDSGPRMPEQTLPDAGGGGGRRSLIHPAADDRMDRIERMLENIAIRSHHTVEVHAAPGLTARTKAMRAHGNGPVKPNVGVSMPDAEGGRWV